MHRRVAVVGAGSWGTTLAWLLARNGWEVGLHCIPVSIADGIIRERHNPLYFPDVELPASIDATADLPTALHGATTAYLAVPTRYLRQFVHSELGAWRAWAVSAGPGPRVLCNCTKGLLLKPTQRTDEWLAALLPGVPLVHLAGPNLAAEIIAGQPAAAVAAGPQDAADQVLQQLMSDSYRVYTGGDTVGVEVAGFYKNIIAIAAGALTGLALGGNTRAVLITRGLSEMGRLVAYFGGQPQTLSGLAGAGDLIVTCSSPLSRNFQVGLRRAAGQALAQIAAEMTQVAEGIQAAEAVHRWPEEHGLSGWPELPIAAQVYRFLYEGVRAEEAILALMRRPPKAE
jgi:glycerol-3-phosphate dehydrogenase (NAD(P)+)